METPLPPATDLLMDLLSVPAGRPLSVRALCSAGEHLGFPENAVRVALTRLVRQGKIEKVGRGAYAVHPSQLPLINDVAHWRSRLDWMGPWEGGWIAVADPALPAAQRTAQRRHDRALDLRGFRTWRPGFHIRPDNLIGGAEALSEQLARLGLAEGAEVVALKPLRHDQAQDAAALWDVAALHCAYGELLAQVEGSLRRQPTQELGAAARESLLLGRTVIARLARDPLLPDALMKGDARHRLVQAMDAYQQASRSVWEALIAPSDQQA